MPDYIEREVNVDIVTALNSSDYTKGILVNWPCQISGTANRRSGEARSRKSFSILFAVNNETTQSFLPI